MHALTVVVSACAVVQGAISGIAMEPVAMVTVGIPTAAVLSTDMLPTL